VRADPIILVLVGGLILGFGVGGLVHDAVTRLKPPHQSASGEGVYRAVAGFGPALMIVASWLKKDRDGG